MPNAAAFGRWHLALTHLAFFLALAIAWTWPLATRLTWRMPHDPGDPILNTWILWWNTQALPFSSAWWSPPVFYPLPGAFALSEHLAGIALFTAPLHFAGLGPIAAYNVAFILSTWLSGYFAFLLGRRLTGSVAAGLIAGIAFAIAPYRASQLSHLQVLTAQWMPLALFAMHAFLDDGRRRWLALLAAAWLLQALSNGYYLLFFPVLVGLWLLWFVDWRHGWRCGAALAATFAGASLLLLPALVQYKRIHDGLGLERSVDEMRQFSATLTSFVQPGYLLTFWPTRDAATQEGFLFPGVTVVALGLLGLAALIFRRQVRDAAAARSPAMFYGLAALLLWWLCFGPPPEHPSAVERLRPYTLLAWLPGFNGLRVPARFAMLATLCIALTAAIGAARLAPAARWRRLVAGGLVAGGLFVDGWIDGMPLAAPPQPVLIDAPADAVVLELPAGEPAVNVAAMDRAIAHGRPLINGYSGHTPRHYDLLATSLLRGDPSILAHYARGAALVVVVHRDRDMDGAFRRLVEGAGGVLREESAVGPIFVVPPQPRERTPGLGPALAAVPVDAPAGYAAVDLGADRVVRAITINLRWRYAEIGPRLTIERSSDAVTWTTAWDGWAGDAALTGALADQLAVPMTIYLPDVRARYLRVSPAPPWVARELSAFSASR
jgi:hypothetical protein